MPRCTTSANCTGTLSAAQKTPETARPRSGTPPERGETRAPSAHDASLGSSHAARHALFRDSLLGRQHQRQFLVRLPAQLPPQEEVSRHPEPGGELDDIEDGGGSFPQLDLVEGRLVNAQ